MDYPVHETPPAWPGHIGGRYRWLPKDDPDAARVRADVQEHGKGLLVLWCPARQRKVVVEAWQPWELPPVYREPVYRKIPKGDPSTLPDLIVVQPDDYGRVRLSRRLNPIQHADAREGRYVVLAEIAVLNRPLHADPRPLVEIRRGNRAACSRYKYDQGASPAAYRAAELEAKVVDPRREREAKESMEISKAIANAIASRSGEFPQVSMNQNGGE